ncbi:hypothetical protein O987_17200 [Comamonas testosteroni TK102]|uniref:Uncharacterized protein n=1 Tax=Comamonas testosteroni TK102 TaxID=1392005 RepID=A0A076PW57_COMTE|nr:hypothetical protein O987_17200 [Comamonas testosteroni TK102]
MSAWAAESARIAGSPIQEATARKLIALEHSGWHD